MKNKKEKIKSILDPIFEPLTNENLFNIKGGVQEYTCTSNAENDRTYVTTNSDQIYHGDGSGAGTSWIEDIGR